MKVEGILQNNGIINDHSGSVNTVIVTDKAPETAPAAEPKPRKAPSKTKSAIQLKDLRATRLASSGSLRPCIRTGTLRRWTVAAPPKKKCSLPSESL